MDAKDIRAVSETDTLSKSAPAQLLPNGNGARLNSHTLTDNQRAEELRQAELKQVENLVSNVMLARSEMFRQLFDPRRDIDDECGYPRSQVGSGAGAINIELFNTLYEREAIACRVVQVLPKESWQVQPLIYEDEDTENVTEFEEAWDNLGKNLNGGQVSYYKDEADSPIWEHLKRADIQSGIGHFGILLIGIDDGLDLGEPADGVATLEAPILNRSFSTNAEMKTALRKFATRSIPTKPNNTIPTYEVVEKKNGGLPIFVGNREMTAEELQRENYLTNNKDSFDMAGLRSDRDKAYNMPSIDSAGVPGSGSTPLGSATSPMGTDAQYVGVQLGPSEYLATKPSTEKRKLIYLRAFNESLVQVVQYEANVHNPRFGQPVMYRVTLNDPREQHSGIGLPMATVRVHWSRLIHLADNLGSSEIFGVPRMRPVLNRLLDLRKLYSGSAEMYWRGAFPGISLETNPQMGGDVIVDTTAIKSMMEQYMNGLQRYLQLTGLSAKTLSPQVVDPTPQINTQIEAIAIQLGIPKRVFCGSERGELASSQDDASWNDRLRERQHNYITPRIIIPFIDRLIAMGVLPVPKVGKNNSDEASNKVAKSLADKAGGGGAPPDQSALPASSTSSDSNKRSEFQAHSRLIYNLSNGEAIGVNASAGYYIEWPDLDSQTAGEKATVALTKTNAMATYISGQVEAMMPPRDYYVHVLGMNEEEAANILEGAAKAHEEEDVMTTPPMIGGRPTSAPPGTQDHEDASMKAEAARQRADILQQGIDLEGKTAAEGPPPEIQEKEKLTTHGQNSLEDIQRAGESLAQSPLVMPGYQQIFIKGSGSYGAGDLWYVGSDADDEEFESLMRKTLSAIDGVGDISYEAEAFPPKDEGWVQVYPEMKHWTANSFCPTGEGGGIDPSCSPGGERPSVSKDYFEAGKAFQAVSLKIARDNTSNKYGPSHETMFPGNRYVSVSHEHNLKTGESRMRVDFGVKKDSGLIDREAVVKPIGHSLDKEAIPMLRFVKEVVQAYHAAGFKIEVVPSDPRRREFYAKQLTKMGLKKVRTEKKGAVEVWNLDSSRVDNAELEGGQWITTQGGSHIYIKDGEPVAGNPKVIEKMKGKSEKVSAGSYGSGENEHPVGSFLGHPGHIGADIGHLAHSDVLSSLGDIAHGGGSAIAAIKLLGGKIGATTQMVEHVVKSYVSDKVGAAVAKLPTSMQKAVNGVWAVMKMGSKAAFASYTASQAFAERVSKERGLTDEQSRRLRGTLSTADVALAKPTALALGAAASFVPVASVGYLAYSTARDPLATLRAARSTIKGAVAGIKSKAGNIEASLKGRFAGNMLTDNEYTILKNALHDHDYDDWYIALVSSAIDEVGDIAGAVEVANKAYEANPTDQSEVEGDEDTE